ncbi:MAG: DNA repair protein RecO [Oscillospiraceae bacterium]|nr:DNA repair protein RecO [Oscillospiraceae bacterium]
MITTKGIVISSRNVNENDRNVTIITEQLGVIDIFARGAQKMTASSNSSTQLFAYSEFCFNERKGRYFLESAKPVSIFYGIRSDIVKVALASYFAELVRYAVMALQPSEETMRLLLNTLHFLSEGTFSCAQLKSIFELRFVCCVGHTPLLLGCRECHKYDDDFMFFVYKDGSLLCGGHYYIYYSAVGEEYYPVTARISRTVLHAMRTICLTDMKRVFSFKITGDSLDSLGEITETYLLTQLDHHFKTLDFYNEVKDTNP